MKRRSWLKMAGLGAAAPLIASCGRKIPKLDQATYATEIRAVIKQHAEVCSSAYTKAWQLADTLRGKTDVFLAKPTAASHGALRDAWSAAHLAYMETECLRGLGTPADGLHSKIAAWPVDPAALDSVPGKLSTGAVHDRLAIPEFTVDALRAAHQPRANSVITGFHAIEFLIYGSDLYDDGPGARVFTDYTAVIGFERRRELLQILTRLLSSDLALMSAAWHPSEQGNYREQFMAQPPQSALTTIFTGIIAPCQSGLSGALTRPLESGDQKDEICQFSDTSLEAIRHAITGIQNSFTGNAPGRVLAADQVPLFGLIAKADPSVATELENGFAQLLAKLNGLTAPFDQMIKPGQPGRATLEEVAAGLVSQGEVLGKVGVALGAKLSSMA